METLPRMRHRPIRFHRYRPLIRKVLPVSEGPNAVVGEMNEETGPGECPYVPPRPNHPTEGAGNRVWWPNQLNLSILRKHPAVANPMGEEFDYAAAFNSLDLDALTADVDCAVGDTPCLTASNDRGFVIDEAEVVYWGTCPECAAATSSSTAIAP